MKDDVGFPWSKINDFLLYAGSARNEPEFNTLVLQGLGDIIPSDYASVLFQSEGNTDIPIAVSGSETIVQGFNKYYRFHLPIGAEYLDSHEYVDWTIFSESEFFVDFIKPLGVRYVLSRRSGYIPNLMRSNGSPSFSEKEGLIFRTILPHLDNLHSYQRKISRLSRESVSRAELAHDCRVLSRREAEVVRLMSLRMTAREIASLLRISPRTVECHVANAFDKLRVTNRDSLLSKVFGTDIPTLPAENT